MLSIGVFKLSSGARTGAPAGSGLLPRVSWERRAPATLTVAGLEASATAAVATYRLSVNGQPVRSLPLNPPRVIAQFCAPHLVRSRDSW